MSLTLLILSALTLPAYWWATRLWPTLQSLWLLAVSIILILIASPLTLLPALPLVALARWIGAGGHGAVPKAGFIGLCVGAVFLARTQPETWPLGLSFLSFCLISYIADPIPKDGKEAKGETTNLFSGALFFPYLMAGPVVRLWEILPQVQKKYDPQYPALLDGGLRISLGLTKKMIGDMLGALADLQQPSMETSAVSAWIYVLAKMGQFYADFSGYTDIAIGLASLFGVRLPENFRLPYLATSIPDFWRRWHISLNLWFRRYVFSPMVLRLRFLGGASVAISILVTTALIGVWHGPSTGHLAWGLYHGLLLIATTAAVRLYRPSGRWWIPIQIVITFYLVAIGRTLDTQNSLAASWRLVQRLHDLSPGWPAFGSSESLYLLLATAGLVIPHSIDAYTNHLRERAGATGTKWALLLLSAILILAFHSEGKSFLYEGY